MTKIPALYTTRDGAPCYATNKCVRCGRVLKDRVMLELNWDTGEYSEPGTVPAEVSQGCFEFGSDCAKALLKRSAMLKDAQ